MKFLAIALLWCSNGYVKDRCDFPISSGDFCANDTQYTTMKNVFGYNAATGRCEQYIYYGCGGYGNRFNTRQECWNTCGRKSRSKCTLPDTGLSGAHWRYYYDIKSDTCKSRYYFYYTTDEVNRFFNLRDCEIECK
ncbi:hypothetical protein V5799_011952, partial [Amblyomma americanum]